MARPAPTPAYSPPMERVILTRMIRSKLADGRLPHNHIPRMWGGPGNGEVCDACGELVTKAQMVMEGLSVATEPSATDEASVGVQFHVQCFQIWDAERRVGGHDPSRPA